MNQLNQLADELRDMADMVEFLSTFNKRKAAVMEALSTVSVEDPEPEETPVPDQAVNPKPPSITDPKTPAKRGRKKSLKRIVDEHMESLDPPFDWDKIHNDIIQEHDHLDSEELREGLIDLELELEAKLLEEGGDLSQAHWPSEEQ